MLVFVECPECKETIKVATKNDIKLLVTKNKEIVPIECPSCKSTFEVSFKLKLKDKKNKSKLALY
jgi:transcription elongation factor Elf1